MDLVGWIPEDTKPNRLWNGFLEQVYIFRAQLQTLVRPPRDVAPRARKAGNDSASNRIGSKPYGDGYRFGGLLGSKGRWRGRGDDEVHL